ncbi:hypothetical protein SAMN04487934_106112 [Eubacterium ruminantium]|nr:hypothetical protein SAMN04487934_106112 [Eubacterium ruminantium]
MGKDLKGKELGSGLSQRKDGRYSARFVTSYGKRIEKYFSKYQDARRWLAVYYYPYFYAYSYILIWDGVKNGVKFIMRVLENHVK